MLLSTLQRQPTIFHLIVCWLEWRQSIRWFERCIREGWTPAPTPRASDSKRQKEDVCTHTHNSRTHTIPNAPQHCNDCVFDFFLHQELGSLFSQIRRSRGETGGGERQKHFVTENEKTLPSVTGHTSVYIYVKTLHNFECARLTGIVPSSYGGFIWQGQVDSLCC